jgi:hypothetical protein
MNSPRLLVHVFWVVLLCPTTLVANNDVDTNSPADLVTKVARNELADRAQRGRWMYCVERREGGRTFTRRQIETKDGALYRLLLIDQKAPNAELMKEDTHRLDWVLNDTKQRAKLKNDYENDESTLQKLIRILPEAFVYEFAGKEGNLVTLKFRPSPLYSPATYEMRIAHQLTGILVVDVQQKRLVRLSGRLESPVQFGFGLLGRVEKGGTIEIARTQVAPNHWKTSLINIEMDGRILFFKTINKQQHEVRYHFERAPADLSLGQARELLFSSAIAACCEGM